jgi:hypothetical protein
MMAEATGLLPKAVIHGIPAVLTALPKRVFDRPQLEAAVREAGLSSEIDALALGEYLFLQGAIGNYRPDEGYVQFYHRRDAYSFLKRGPWVLHTGLVYALNIPWSGV